MPAYLIFTDENTAKAAILQITENIGLPLPGCETTTFAIQFPCSEGWYINKPGDQYMSGVVGYTVSETITAPVYNDL